MGEVRYQRMKGRKEGGREVRKFGRKEGREGRRKAREGGRREKLS